MIVIDASAAICLLANRPADRVNALQVRLRDEELHAPHLIDLEVAQTLRRFVLRGAMAADVAVSALADLAHSPLSRHPHYLFLRRIWEMRSNLTAYDGAYVALAEFLDAPLVTLDARIARAVVGVSVEVF